MSGEDVVNEEVSAEVEQPSQDDSAEQKKEQKVTYQVALLCKDGTHVVYTSEDIQDAHRVATAAVKDGVYTGENNMGGVEVFNVFRASVRKVQG